MGLDYRYLLVFSGYVSGCSDDLYLSQEEGYRRGRVEEWGAKGNGFSCAIWHHFGPAYFGVSPYEATLFLEDHDLL